jgi:ribonuclease P protein component
MHCFKKSQRLLNKAAFDGVFAKAEKISLSRFILLFRDNQLGYARIGMALSKRAIAKAHDRNRIKRIFRESFRLTKNLPSIDIVILAKPGASSISSSLLTEKLDTVWKKISATNDH